MAPKLKFDESVVSGRKGKKLGEIRPQQPLPSAHDWKKVVGVVVEEKKEEEEPFPTYGLLDTEENQASELKRKLVEIHKNLIDNHLETVLTTDEILHQWLSKISKPGYTYLSPSLDINKEPLKAKNTGKTERDDLSESKAAGYYVEVDCWWWNDNEKKQHKAEAVKLIAQAQKVYGQLMDVYNGMWAREKVKSPSSPLAPREPKKESKKQTAGANEVEKNNSTAAAKEENKIELKEDDYSVFSNWIKAFKTRSEMIAWRLERKTKLNREVRGNLAIKRLMRDLRDCHRHPIPGIAAAPITEDDLRLWHCNIQAPPDHPWSGRVFHISMKFDQTYPEEPPVVKALTPIRHPNVFGNYICLDMLCAPGSRFQSDDGVTGWTSAYSVQSILLQLQAFLLAPSFMRAIVPDKAEWLRKNADGIAYNRYDASGKAYGVEELKKIKKAAYDNAYRAAFRHIWGEDSWEARLLKKAAEYKCTYCGHSPHQAKPECPSYHTTYQAPAAAYVAPATAAVGSACLPPSLSSSPTSLSSSPTPLTTSSSTLEPKLTASSLFTSLLSAEAPDTASAPLTPVPVLEVRVPLDTTTSGPWALAPGDLLIGVVTRFLPMGALVDVKWEFERDGLVHISQLPRLKDPFQRIEHPSEVVSIGQKVTVRVTEVDEDYGRLSLSMRPEPTNRGPRGGRDRSENGCEGAPPVGTVCTGTVKDVKERIAFVAIGAKRDGVLDLPFPLLSRSERKNGVEYLWWDVAKVLRSHVGDKIKVQVDALEDKPRLILPPNVQCSGTASRPRPTANAFVPAAAARERSSWDDLSDNENLMMLIMGYLSRAELHVLGSQRPCSDPIANRVRLMAPLSLATEFLKDDLVCFHSRVSFEDELLGVGLNLEHYDSGDLSNISPNLDLISENAFYFEKIRTGVWQKPFTHWMPLYLSSRHAGNLERHEQAIAEVARNKALHNTKVAFHPPMVLKVLPSLLNTMIVEIMKGKTHESEVALQGYLSFYHLFLAFTIKYPELQKEIDNRVKVFLESERGRMKRVCPNLGEWLACLACSSYSWKQVAVAAITEVFDRNVKWTVMEFPELVNLRELEDMEIALEEEEKEEAVAAPVAVKVPEIAAVPVVGLSKSARRRLREKKSAAWEAVIESSKPTQQVKLHVPAEEPDPLGLKLDRGRLPKTWKVTQVSSRLVMFHVLFLRMFRLAPASGKGEDEEDMEVSLLSIEQAKRKLDQSYGRATHRITQLFQRGVKRILDTPDWAGFFTRCLLPVPDPNFLCRWLQRAAINSGRKRYHDADAVNKALGDVKAANKAKRDAAKAALDPLARFDEDEKASLGKGFLDHEKQSAKYDKYENTRGGRFD
jgi:ubiquitin-protein ligase/predicted RNA-binding protein with RPS1 domain